MCQEFDVHSLGIYKNKEIEAAAPDFNSEELHAAQERSWRALDELYRNIKPGMDEVEATRFVGELLHKLGAKRSWHRPIVRFGENTAKPFSVPPQVGRILGETDIFYIDIGPTWLGADGIEYEGDVGNTFALSSNPAHQHCIDNAKELFKLGCKFWHDESSSGINLYKYLSDEARKRGYELVPEDDGHRIGDFPHKRVFSGPLSATDFHPSADRWVLEIHLREVQGRYGAFFEDVLR